MDLFEELGINRELLVGELHEIAFEIMVLGKELDTSGRAKSFIQKRADAATIEVLKKKLQRTYVEAYFPDVLSDISVKEVIKEKEISLKWIIPIIMAAMFFGAVVQAILSDHFDLSIIDLLNLLKS